MILVRAARVRPGTGELGLRKDMWVTVMVNPLRPILPGVGLGFFGRRVGKDVTKRGARRAQSRGY